MKEEFIPLGIVPKLKNSLTNSKQLSFVHFQVFFKIPLLMPSGPGALSLTVLYKAISISSSFISISRKDLSSSEILASIRLPFLKTMRSFLLLNSSWKYFLAASFISSGEFKIFPFQLSFNRLFLVLFF